MLSKYRSTFLASSTTLTMSDVDTAVQEKCPIISSQIIANLGARVTGQLANLRNKNLNISSTKVATRRNVSDESEPCVLYTLAIFLTNPSLLEGVMSFTFCRVTTMSAATASRRELHQVFSSQPGYEILSLSRATFSARCTRK